MSLAFVQPSLQQHGPSPGDSMGLRVRGLRGIAPSPEFAALRASAQDGSMLAVAGAVLGGAILSTMASRASRCRTGVMKTVRCAEPISGAAAAAAAAKAAGAAKAASAAKAAAAAKGALKTAVAVGGSAGTGSLAQSMGQGEMYDEELLKRKWKTSERGTPEYEKAMALKRKVNEMEWARRTGRNPEGYDASTVPNDPDAANANAYDILISMDARQREEARQAGVALGEFDPALCVGVTDPMEYFDPLGFSKKGNEEGFRKLRAAEIKHGRVAMMAAAGAVIQHYVKFPGFEKVPAGLAAATTEPGQTGFIALFLVAGALELGLWTESPNKAPGNFGDPLGLNQYTVDMRNRELNNGRAAMFAAMGIIIAELVTGKDAIEQLAK
eukprot:TRINITY_DN2088_c0_g1_i3.p1 TRINITY_DN2088_c0_g1~~TRINITY_DN2088_c0_g1_i3.p1  ORF type:complete len:384 (-),score=91.08 TRINITY_DN2088_c0_g1_i3:386-1537(-)